MKADIAVRHYEVTPAGRKRKALRNLGVERLIDVGANKGQAAGLYRRNGFRGHILSVEPDSGSVAILQQRASKDPKWDVLRAAVGDKPGTMKLNISEETQFNSLRPITEMTVKNSAYARYVQTEEVEVQTLDQIADSYHPTKVLGLKIDVQGFEEEVLNGAAKALARAQYVDIELTPVEMYEGQILMLDLMRRMEDEGFSLLAIEDTYSDMKTGQVLGYNGVYCRL
ncbi:MAG: FkbM family methyltransferase [Nocardioidaceae bacterium]|nr:FkbM family methyltransferase [Nocardioidaceae bacterium]